MSHEDTYTIERATRNLSAFLRAHYRRQAEAQTGKRELYAGYVVHCNGIYAERPYILDYEQFQQLMARLPGVTDTGEAYAGLGRRE